MATSAFAPALMRSLLNGGVAPSVLPMPRSDLPGENGHIRAQLHRERRNAAKEFGDAQPHLALREMLAEAKMRAAAEAEVPVGLALQYRVARILELIGIEVAGHRVAHH